MSRWQWDGVVGYNGENDAWEAYLTYAMHAWAVFRSAPRPPPHTTNERTVLQSPSLLGRPNATNTHLQALSARPKGRPITRSCNLSAASSTAASSVTRFCSPPRPPQSRASGQPYKAFPDSSLTTDFPTLADPIVPCSLCTTDACLNERPVQETAMPLRGLRANRSEKDLHRHSTLDPGGFSKRGDRTLSANASAEILAPDCATASHNGEPSNPVELGRASWSADIQGPPPSPPIQEHTPNTRRFSIMRFRHASDSQLSAKAKEHAARSAPPVPAIPTGKYRSGQPAW